MMNSGKTLRLLMGLNLTALAALGALLMNHPAMKLGPLSTAAPGVANPGLYTSDQNGGQGLHSSSNPGLSHPEDLHGTQRATTETQGWSRTGSGAVVSTESLPEFHDGDADSVQQDRFRRTGMSGNSPTTEDQGSVASSSDSSEAKRQAALLQQRASSSLSSATPGSLTPVAVSQNLPPLPTANAAIGGSSPQIPLAFIEPLPGDSLDQSQMDALVAMQAQFAQEMGYGPPLDPSSPQYAARWNQLQGDLDSQYLAQFGFDKFNTYIDLANQIRVSSAH